MDDRKDFSFTGYQHRHLESARALRQDMSPAETRLWQDYCRGSRYKFYRQIAIDRFIVDFYCSKAKLIIEFDGQPHFTPDGKCYDSVRTEILERFGLKVIRFTNTEVMTRFDWVCAQIDDGIKRRMDGCD